MSFSLWPLTAAAIAATVIGYGWYHPKVFGARWMRENGMTPEMAERGARRVHFHEAIGFVAALITAFVLRSLLAALGAGDVGSASRIAFLLWLGFAAPILLGSVLWEHRPVSLYCINALYWLLALLAMAAILVV